MTAGWGDVDVDQVERMSLDPYTERFAMRRIVEAHQTIRQAQVSEAVAIQRMEYLDRVEKWLRAEDYYSLTVKKWLAAEKRWKEIGERAKNDPALRAAEAGWNAIRRECPTYDGSHIHEFKQLPVALQERYAVFAAAAMNLASNSAVEK